jgi:hypothetical protein
MGQCPCVNDIFDHKVPENCTSRFKTAAVGIVENEAKARGFQRLEHATRIWYQM